MIGRDYLNLGRKASRPAEGKMWGVLCLGVFLTALAPAIVAAPDGGRRPPATAPSDSIDQAMTYASDDRAILDLVQDGDSQFEGSALYILLRQAAMLPSPREVLRRADRPSPDNLWRSPGNYRGKLIALKGHYAGVTEQRVAGENRWFGARTYCLVHTKVPGAREAVILALPGKPPPLRLGQLLEFAGTFYKTVMWETRAPATDDRNIREYPVLVVKGLVEAEAFTFPERSSGIAGAIGAVAGALGILLAIRYYLRRRRRSGGFPVGAGGWSVPDDARSVPVDPDLCRIVEEMKSQAAIPTAEELSARVGPTTPDRPART